MYSVDVLRGNAQCRLKVGPELSWSERTVFFVSCGRISGSDASRRQRRVHLALYFRDFAGTPGHFQIVEVLQIKPEFCVCIDGSRQPQGSLRGDPAPLVDNFTDPRGRSVRFIAAAWICPPRAGASPWGFLWMIFRSAEKKSDRQTVLQEPEADRAKSVYLQC
jgi:hypothetical protein